jgi:hypothetical protein
LIAKETGAFFFIRYGDKREDERTIRHTPKKYNGVFHIMTIESDKFEYKFSRAQQQREAILQHLKAHGTLTTLEARDILNIMHPAGRVLELIRGQGYKIDTVYGCFMNETGSQSHHCGRYILQGGEVAA